MPKRLPSEEIARRGEQIYHTCIADTLDESDIGKLVFIDVESGEFLLAEDEIAGSDEIRRRLPDPQVWLRKAGPGSGATRRYGRRAS